MEEVEEQVKKIIDEVKELHDSSASFISRSSQQELSLRQQASFVDSSIRRLHSSLLSNKNLDPKLVDKLEEDLHRARCMLVDGETSSFLPSKPQGRFVRMFLGPVNVRALRKDVQLKVKEEYNSYRLYEAWLLFLYAGLAMRENILRVNGSDIRPWWLYHHYCAMLMALVSLTWEIKGQPNCVQKQRGVHLFLQWAMMQGVAMLLQNRYQRQRLYTRIALGKAKRMDVVWGETAGVDGQLWLLCPILFLLQVFEAYVGLQLLRKTVTGVVTEWQVMVCGILLVVMAVGNFINTVETLMAKSRVKAKMKRSKSKAELN
ncbi:PREDICTED: transmembrane protein 120 homolog isoform X2 [Camelina sativa]|uniref:Transmembrane protein 120 homolog isoform X2 n=1 Tax=Camelina sativa TaxID=90675 RepID=A0ABM1QV83_CAMSA|nr:PREDICTED: transmembrane protein 120 homolog isoform X2 [Camelina sativa]